MDMDEMTFLEQFRPQGPPDLGRVFAAAMRAEPGDLAEAAEERERLAEAASRRENLEMANRAAGNPIGRLSQVQAVMSQARDEVQDLQARLEAAQETLSRARVTHAELSADVERLMMEPRSVSPDLLAESKRAMAAVRVDQMLSRAASRAASRPVSRARPFGVAARSEPVTCADCIKYGASEEESWMIHNDPAPDPVPDDFVWEPAERHRAYSGREIAR